jgi:transposase
MVRPRPGLVAMPRPARVPRELLWGSPGVSQGAGSNYKNSCGDHRRGPVVVESDEHGIGRSRGGLTTKVHALVDGAGRPLVLLVTAGNINDTVLFPQLMAGLRIPRTGCGRPRTRPDHVLGDKGYSSRANRQVLRARGIPHTIPERRDQQLNRLRRGRAGGRPVGFDKDLYKRRNVVERSFCQLKHWRGLATRYEKHARNYLGGLTLAALLTWLP